MNDVKSRGQEAETYAEHYLAKQGFVLIQRNFRCKMGEIDLIMRDANTLVFIEVRYRHSTYFGGAAASVDRRKQIKLIKTAQYYLAVRQKYAKMACRFDVMAIQGSLSVPTQVEIEWIKNAFDAN